MILIFSFRNSDGIEDICIPRVINNLNLCFNPGALIPDKVSELTGLNNELLKQQSRFSQSTGIVLKSFLDHLTPPVCLVAHNGDRYDYPLLKAELECVGHDDLGPDVHVVDSLQSLRKIFDEPEVKKKLNFDKPNSFSLPKLHEHIFGNKPKTSHGSEVDVMALIRVCAFIAEAFVKYAECHSSSFKCAKKMGMLEPGK